MDLGLPIVPVTGQLSEPTGLWLYDIDGNATAVLREGALITRRRFREHSAWDGKFPLIEMPGTPYATNYDALADAYFARVAGAEEVYLVENLKLITGGGQEYIEVAESRSASALLHTRTIVGTKDWHDKYAGEMVADVFADFTGARALPLAFGSGLTLGGTFSVQRSWGDAGEALLELLAAKQLGMRTRFENGVVKLDIIAAAATEVRLGEKYKDGSSMRLVTDDAPWRNYAYVLGEGEGAARVQVIVDQTAGGPRRELYVDASDLQRGEMTLAAYQAQLAARGAAKLAEFRRVEFAESSDVTAPLNPGDVVWQQSKRWGQTYMATQVETSIEGGRVKHAVSLGDPPTTLQKSIRRMM